MPIISFNDILSPNNIGYFKKFPGILKLIEILLGFLGFLTILLSCQSYHDSFLEINIIGFAGGKSETFFFLFSFAFLITTSLISLSILTTPISSESITRNNFNFIYHFTAFIMYTIISMTLLIEILSRNHYMTYKEPKYLPKIIASIFGLLTSLAYFLSTIFAFKRR